MTASLRSESFLPSGAFDSNMALPIHARLPYDTDLTNATLSSIPPAANHHQLPPHLMNNRQSSQSNQQHSHQQSQRGRLPPASSFPLQPTDTHPLSLSSLRAAQAASQNYLSKHLRADVSANPHKSQNPRNPRNLRTASLSPSRSAPHTINDRGLPPSSTTPLSSVPEYLAGASLSRSVSADAAPPTQQTSLFMVQRLVQQNTLIREAWEAERNYLETNRRRAEEVYQEERAIMDLEKLRMLREIESLKEGFDRLQDEYDTLKADIAESIQISTAHSIQMSRMPCFSAPAAYLASRSPLPGVPTSFSMADASTLPPGLDSASRRPHFRCSPGSSRVSPTAQSHPAPFVPMDPRMQPQNAIAKDFLSSPSDCSEAPVPIIDVQEIDPKLEGIPIKATAVQRSTFSVCGSPPEHPPSAPTSPPFADALQHMEPKKPLTLHLSSSKEHTLQALNAVESQRLTMHAGHTPNHSLSLFSTVATTKTSSIGGMSEGATPIAEIAAVFPIQAEEPDEIGDDTPTREPDQSEALAYGIFDHPEPVLDPNEDRPLKGPLMIKNIPAQDEIFWEAVNRKLTPISQGENALPAVMQSTPEDLESIVKSEPAEPTNALDQRPRVLADPVIGDGLNDTHMHDGHDFYESSKGLEKDVPLKFKTTSNFGAPFGAL
ncbi:hypothetical protein AK830_g12632 [Neonectria ditissima]|uniref:Uncharacterized protein n=1 Tax=Neonectria ditissima TaxID=78410 RepID=A0A0N8H4P4_9HYPO|nr:hypothetical protein AK830_g12632 [Neonectria ditissima]